MKKYVFFLCTIFIFLTSAISVSAAKYDPIPEGGETTIINGIKYKIIDNRAMVIGATDEDTGMDITQCGENVVIPEQITGADGKSYTVDEIVGGAFCGNTTIKSIVIPDTITVFGTEHSWRIPQYEEGAIFLNASSLETIKLSSNTKEIPKHTFAGCVALKEIDIPDSVEIINTGAFFMTALQNVTVPASVKTIGSYAFSYMSNLKSVTFLHSDADEIEMQIDEHMWSTGTAYSYTFWNDNGVEIITESSNVVDKLVKQAQDAVEGTKDASGSYPANCDETASSNVGFTVKTQKGEDNQPVLGGDDDNTPQLDLSGTSIENPADEEKSASKAEVSLRAVTTSDIALASDPITSNANEYEIVVKAVPNEEEGELATFKFAALQFEFTNEGAAGAEIIPAKGMSLVKNAFEASGDMTENTYSLYVNPLDGDEGKTGSRTVNADGTIVIGTVKLTGKGEGTVKISDSKLYTEITDSIVKIGRAHV